MKFTSGRLETLGESPLNIDVHVREDDNDEILIPNFNRNQNCCFIDEIWRENFKNPDSNEEVKQLVRFFIFVMNVLFNNTFLIDSEFLKFVLNIKNKQRLRIEDDLNLKSEIHVCYVRDYFMSQMYHKKFDEKDYEKYGKSIAIAERAASILMEESFAKNKDQGFVPYCKKFCALNILVKVQAISKLLNKIILDVDKNNKKII